MRRRGFPMAAIFLGLLLAPALARAAPGATDLVEQLRADVQKALQGEQSALAAGRSGADVQRLVKQARESLKTALARTLVPLGPTMSVPYFPGWEEFAGRLSGASKLDERALGEAARGQAQKAKGLLQRAISEKQKALAALPRSENLGCMLTREGIGGGEVTSFKITKCAKPIGFVYVSGPRSTVVGSSILPGERHAQCIQVPKKGVACEIKPPAKPTDEVYVDVKNPPAMTTVTTCTVSGAVTGCCTKTG